MFLDQRENRRRRGARVLDVYTYAGGFALAALRGGAAAATCVDSSARALERARAHAAANALGPLETVEADAFRYLETARPKSWDLVIVDPPKFARARKDLDAAMKGYHRLNVLALTACAEGALLGTCSCSQLVEPEAFERMLAAAAKDAGRRVQLLAMASQGADHPVPPAFPEGRYLKFALLRVL
jgi:23S rRNA (cytosine1962-C5)-methyltransferase